MPAPSRRCARRASASPLASTSSPYDAEGERTGSDNLNTATTTSYDWNQAGELTGFNGVASYAYNGDGLRVTKTVGGSTQHFAWDATASAPEMLTDGTTDYIYGPSGQVIEQYTPEEPIALVGTDNASVNVAGGTITLYLPPGAAAGDEAVIFVDTTDSTAKANEVSAPAGYTESAGPIYNGTEPAIDGLELDVFTRTITASDIGASISITIPTGEASSANLLLYSGVDPSLPVDAITDGYLSSGTSVTLPSMNASVPNEVLVAGYAAEGTATLNQDFTLPSDLKNEREGTVSGYIKVDSADEPLTNAGATGPQQATFSGAGAPLAVAGLTLRQPPTVLFYQADGQGSTRLLTDMTGAVRATYDYDGYGNVVAGPTNSATTQLQFDGSYVDAETGFSYLQARYYDPSTGQFVSRDNMLSLSQQPYVYASDDPRNLSDPLGEFAIGAPITAAYSIAAFLEWVAQQTVQTRTWLTLAAVLMPNQIPIGNGVPGTPEARYFPEPIFTDIQTPLGNMLNELVNIVEPLHPSEQLCSAANSFSNVYTINLALLTLPWVV